jgi:hypothetical protein
VHLGDRRLADHRERLVRVAAHTTPPLFWACEITFDELLCRLFPDDQAEFEKYRRALWWMEKLSGELGTAEDKDWALRAGVFAGSVPCNRARGAMLVDVRREILRAKTYEDLPPLFRSKLDDLRAGYRERIDRWVAGRTTVGEAARVEPLPDDPKVEGSAVAANAVLEISRKHALANAPDGGVFKSDEEQRRAQRELIAFEAWYLEMARNPKPYNHASHRSDYNDYWLCAYCAAGYTLVTTDGRLLKAIKAGGCSDPRLVNLDEGLALAESWLAEGHEL